MKWWSTVQEADIFLSVLTMAEIYRGIEKLSLKNEVQAGHLRLWMTQLSTVFTGRIIPVDIPVAKIWARMNSQRSYPVIDSLLAATAHSRDLILATRNTVDFDGCDVRLLDPFNYQP